MSASTLAKVKGWVLVNNPNWSEEQRQDKRLLRRLDVFFLSYLSLSAIVKYLDQSNISNAYVSGMKEDLSLYGNELNYFTTYFNIGYIICIPISSYLINSVVRPSILMPSLELLWGIATGCLAAANNAKVVYGLRFLVGFCEGIAWPGTMILLLSWYRPAEVGLRLAVYQSATSLGGIFAGALQSALYTNLNGASGLAGWQWLFVVNACITVAVAAWGYFGCPDYPNKPNPLAKFWLKDVDVQAALRRAGKDGRALPVGWSWKGLLKTVKRPQNWAIWVCYELIAQGNSGTGYFNLWLKSLKDDDGTKRYTVSQLNLIPMASNFITMVSLFVFLIASDYAGTRWPFVLVIALIGLVFSSILCHWDVPDAAKFASFLILNICSPSANLIVAWLGNIANHSAEERSIIVAVFVMMAYILSASVPLKVWPASQAPHYKIGWKYAVSMYCVTIPAIFLVVYFERRQKRIDAANQPQDEESIDQVAADIDDKLVIEGEGDGDGETYSSLAYNKPINVDDAHSNPYPRS